MFIECNKVTVWRSNLTIIYFSFAIEVITEFGIMPINGRIWFIPRTATRLKKTPNYFIQLWGPLNGHLLTLPVVILIPIISENIVNLLEMNVPVYSYKFIQKLFIKTTITKLQLKIQQAFLNNTLFYYIFISL